MGISQHLNRQKFISRLTITPWEGQRTTKDQVKTLIFFSPSSTVGISPGLWVLSSSSQALLQIRTLEKSQTYLEKQKTLGKNLLILEIKFTDSGCMVAQSRSHLCFLNWKMKIIWIMNMTILDLTNKFNLATMGSTQHHLLMINGA